MDYDYKKKRQGKIPDEELRLAGEKFHESKEAAETSLQNLLDTDVRQLGNCVSKNKCLLKENQSAETSNVNDGVGGTVVFEI